MDANTIWYFDFISPFAYLQLARIRELAEHHAVTPRPIVFAAVLRHHGQLGPAEIPGKREFTYRMAQWTAGSSGIELRFPPAHPFNPLAALRLAIACGSSWEAITAIYQHIWLRGLAGDDAASLAPAVKEQLRANTDQAIAAGVFGVPTILLGDRLIWGNDATSMLEKMLVDPDYFERGEYLRLASLPSAAERSR